VIILQKKRRVEDGSCLFCNEAETVAHMFFESCVSSVLWNEISDVIGMKVGSDFESVARWWLCDKKLKKIECFQDRTAALWSIWKSTNGLCFQDRNGDSLHQVCCVEAI
jgi:hypothetical protein